MSSKARDSLIQLRITIGKETQKLQARGQTPIFVVSLRFIT